MVATCGLAWITVVIYQLVSQWYICIPERVLSVQCNVWCMYIKRWPSCTNAWQPKFERPVSHRTSGQGDHKVALVGRPAKTISDLGKAALGHASLVTLSPSDNCCMFCMVCIV